MTVKEIEILERINKYAEEKLGDIDPQKTQVSKQLSVLMPKLQEIADELGLHLGTVKSRIHFSRQKLIEKLKK